MIDHQKFTIGDCLSKTFFIMDALPVNVIQPQKQSTDSMYTDSAYVKYYTYECASIIQTSQ